VLKTLSFILLSFSLKSYSQTDSLVFYTNAEISVNRYVIQQSSDTSNWANIAIVQPIKKSTNRYAYPLTQKNIYYRIKAVMEQGNYFTFVIPYFALTMKVEPQNPILNLK
jgi:hypothetical protein